MGFQCYNFVVAGSYQAIFGLLSIAIVAVKVTQLDFVAVKLYSDYDANEIIRLVSFSITMSGIYDIADEHKKALRIFLVQEYECATNIMDRSYPILFRQWEI